MGGGSSISGIAHRFPPCVGERPHFSQVRLIPPNNQGGVGHVEQVKGYHLGVTADRLMDEVLVRGVGTVLILSVYSQLEHEAAIEGCWVKDLATIRTHGKHQYPKKHYNQDHHWDDPKP